MVQAAGHPVSVLYGLSVLDPVNQIAFGVLSDCEAQPERYGRAKSKVTALTVMPESDAAIVIDLDERTEIYESISGAPKGDLLPPLSVAEFSWRDSALALARCAAGPELEVAKSMHARSAQSFRHYVKSVTEEAEQAVAALRPTFVAANEILALPEVGAAFGAAPLPQGWIFDDDLDYSSVGILAAVSEELEPEPFGRLSTYEVQVLKRLSVHRRSAMQLLIEGGVDEDQDMAALVDWVQALDDFQLVSASRSLRGQTSIDLDDVSARVDLGFLPPKVTDFISACAAGGT